MHFNFFMPFSYGQDNADIVRNEIFSPKYSVKNCWNIKTNYFPYYIRPSCKLERKIKNE